MQRMTELPTCPTCGIPMERTASEVAEKRRQTRRQYCSYKCGRVSRRVERFERQCPACGGTNLLTQWEIDDGRLYCSMDCYMSVHRRKKRPCEKCGKMFVHEWREKFCSPRCYARSRKGAGNGNWRGGTTTKRGRVADWRARSWARATFESCVSCDAGRWEMHHIIPIRYFDGPWPLANFAENIVPLCDACHMRADADAYVAINAGQRPPFEERLPESILDRLARDGCLSEIREAVDWSPALANKRGRKVELPPGPWTSLQERADNARDA